MHKARCGKWYRAPTASPSVPLSLSVHVAPAWQLSAPCPFSLYGGLITQTGWVRPWAVAGGCNFQALPSPHRWGRGGAESSNLSSAGWFPWQLAPILRWPRRFPKATSLTESQVRSPGLCLYRCMHPPSENESALSPHLQQNAT